MAGNGKMGEWFGKKSGVWKRILALQKSDWAILALVGVLLLVIAMPTGKEDTVSLTGGRRESDKEVKNTSLGRNGPKGESGSSGENGFSGGGATTETGGTTERDGQGEGGVSQQYAIYLEKRLEAVLSKMDGVGRVEVMVTVSDTGESVVEKDVSVKGTITSESDSAGGNRTVTENDSQEQTIYVESENGSEPYLQKEKLPTVEGVVVVAEGAGNAMVISDISESVQALLPVEAHRIKVVKMCSKEE